MDELIPDSRHQRFWDMFWASVLSSLFILLASVILTFLFSMTALGILLKTLNG